MKTSPIFDSWSQQANTLKSKLRYNFTQQTPKELEETHHLICGQMLNTFNSTLCLNLCQNSNGQKYINLIQNTQNQFGNVVKNQIQILEEDFPFFNQNLLNNLQKTLAF